MLKLKRIFLTGGAGFLSSHCYEQIVADHRNMICVDYALDFVYDMDQVSFAGE